MKRLGTLLSACTISALLVSGLSAPAIATVIDTGGTDKDNNGGAQDTALSTSGGTTLTASHITVPTAVASMVPMTSLPPATGANGAKSGLRGAASMVGRSLSDSTALDWNPTNGNLVATGRLLNVRGIGQDLNVAWRYNSLNDDRPTLSVGREETALQVNTGTGAVTYTAPDGGWYTFVSAGTGVWTMPPGLNASLTKPWAGEYRLRFNDTGVTNIYTYDGGLWVLTSSIDGSAAGYTPNPATTTRINAGGPSVTVGGQTWLADTNFTGGAANTNASVTSIGYTDADALYLTGRQGTGEFYYNIPVTAGTYTVKLHFAETYWGATGGGAGGSGQRVFDVNFEGGAVEVEDLDINDLVDPMNAYVLTQDVTVGDTNLDLDFITEVDQAKVSAIEVIRKDPAAPNTITYHYTGPRLTSTTDTQGRTTTFAYQDADNTTQPSSITDTSLGRTINLEYGGTSGRLTKITAASGRTTEFAYTSGGQLEDFTDGRGIITQLEYDTSRRASKLTYGLWTSAQNSWIPAYPAAGQSTLTDPNSKTTTDAYNASNQVTTVTDPLGHTSTGAFDAHDNRTSSTDGLGNASTTTYNANNNITAITSPAGASGGTGGSLTFAYPSATGDPLTNHRPTSAVSSEGHTTTVNYDTKTSAPKKTLTPDGIGGTPEQFFQGDTAGTTCGAKQGSLCRSTDGNGNATTYAYDTAGNPVTVTHPSPLGATVYTYDAAGRVLTKKDGKNQTATYSYDEDDRLTQVRYGTCVAASCVTYTYDEDGNLLTRVDAAGTTTYTWDAQNRLLTKTVGGVTTSLTYDGASNILTAVDPLGTATYKYDGANRLITLAEPGGSCPATPAFPNATKCTGFEYDNNNRRTVTKYPNGVKNTTVYDNAGRITSITAINTSAGILTKRDYTYTLSGTKDGSLRKTMTTNTGTVTTYGYDKLNRLTSAVAGGTTETWSYDWNGNRILETETGSANVHAAFNAANQLCWTGSAAGTCATPPSGATSYAYDANGNTTTAGSSTRGYNVFDQFTANTTAGVTTNYTYAGSRNDELTAAGGTSFLNGTLGTTRQTTSGAATSFIRDPDGTLISMRTSAGDSHYYTTDALGSVIALTDGAQAKSATYTYDSWGVATSTGTAAAANPYRYAGGYRDNPSNLTKFGARYYSAVLGRFTQADPSGQEANTYLYAGANPINNTDSTGLDFWGDFVAKAAPPLVGLAVTAVGVLAVASLSGVIAPLVISGAFGCLAGAAAVATADHLSGSKTSDGGYAGACFGGAIAGAGASALRMGIAASRAG